MTKEAEDKIHFDTHFTAKLMEKKESMLFISSE